MINTKEISKRFRDYYLRKGYDPLPGASLLHPSIPMSFVMSAGLVQIESSLNNPEITAGGRYVLLQKCFRHFDINKIGNKNHYLSLFEMPGAFTFTANGKSQAIKQMWELVTKKLELNPEDLWITFFAGDRISGHNIEADDETHRTWLSLGIPEGKLIGLGAKDNYWQQGGGINDLERYRKCGPNTEIFFDRGSHYSCGMQCRPGCTCGRFVEFANSLFVRFEIDADTQQFYPLDRPFVETVIGTERLAMVVQRKPSVFEIDTLIPLIRTLRRYYNAEKSNPPAQVSEKVIVDHLRALTFLVADGAPPPGKDGRQRLIKILIRKVLTHEMLLNISHTGYRSSLIQETLTVHYDLEHQKSILETTKHYFENESSRFRKTVKLGLHILDKYLKTNVRCSLSGEQIVMLEKRYGLPVELITAQLNKKGLPFHQTEYQMALDTWKEALQATRMVLS